jgi:isoquinoline 1-oxidoreductase alpha subunit
MLKVNGVDRSVDVDGDTPVLWVLRDVLGMTGTKFGCGLGLCGACTVHVNGVATRSCITTVESVASANVSTVESLAATRVGRALQKAWTDLDVPQCGYCQSGQLMSATALLTNNKAPTDADIDAAMSGNICRCGTYLRIRAGIKQAVRALARKGRRHDPRPLAAGCGAATVAAQPAHRQRRTWRRPADRRRPRHAR